MNFIGGFNYLKASFYSNYLSSASFSSAYSGVSVGGYANNYGYNYGYDFYNGGLNSAFNCFYGNNYSNYAVLNRSHLSLEQLSMSPVYRDIIEKRAIYKEQIEKQLVQREKIGKMRDYYFEYRNGQKTRQISPIVMDLNGDGKFDVTDRNPGKDRRIDGRTVKFDIAPDKASWQYKSNWRGRLLYDRLTPQQKLELRRNGKITLNDRNLFKQIDRRAHGHIGQTKEAELRWEHGRPVVYYGKKETRENVEWLKKGAKDGLLVWDVNKDGKITSSKELMGEYDINGRRKFKNGYEKLAYYFDKNKDGVISGNELKGLKIWVDKDGDGITDKGELQDLSKYNITKLNTKMSNAKQMEANFTVGKNEYRTIKKSVLAGYQEIHRRELAGYRLDYTRMDIDSLNYQNAYSYGSYAGYGYGYYGGFYI